MHTQKDTHTHTYTLSSENLSRFQIYLNGFPGQESHKLPTGNKMIFHSNLAAKGFFFKAKKRAEEKEALCFLPQGQFLDYLAPKRKKCK